MRTKCVWPNNTCTTRHFYCWKPFFPEFWALLLFVVIHGTDAPNTSKRNRRKIGKTGENEKWSDVPITVLSWWRLKLKTACTYGQVEIEDCLYLWSGGDWRLSVPMVRWRLKTVCTYGQIEIEDCLSVGRWRLKTACLWAGGDWRLPVCGQVKTATPSITIDRFYAAAGCHSTPQPFDFVLHVQYEQH